MATDTRTSIDTRTRDEVIEWLEERQSRFIKMADETRANPETALREVKACALQVVPAHGSPSQSRSTTACVRGSLGFHR